MPYYNSAEKVLVMKKIKLLSSNELLKLNNFQKVKYYEILKEYSEALEIKKKSQIMKKAAISLCPLLNGVNVEMRGLENIPNRPNETQDNLLSSIQKKVNYSLLPLNKEALIKNPYINNQNLTRRKRKKSNR